MRSLNHYFHLWNLTSKRFSWGNWSQNPTAQKPDMVKVEINGWSLSIHNLQNVTTLLQLITLPAPQLFNYSIGQQTDHLNTQLLDYFNTWLLEYSTAWILEYLTAGKCTGAPQSANYLTNWIPYYLNTQLLECTWILDCREIYCNFSCLFSSVLQIPTIKPCELQKSLIYTNA